MHSRLLVTLESPDISDSEYVRRNAFDQLLADDSFCGEGGRFGVPLADWFVIGGRWSGLLAETVMGSAFKDALLARFPDMDREWLPKTLIEQHAADIDAIWHSLGGADRNPYMRSGYEEYGYHDDAMLLTKELYAALLAEYEGQATGDGYADLDNEQLQPDFVGRKWLVVVDYHS